MTLQLLPPEVKWDGEYYSFVHPRSREEYIFTEEDRYEMTKQQAITRQLIRCFGRQRSNVIIFMLFGLTRENNEAITFRASRTSNDRGFNGDNNAK